MIFKSLFRAICVYKYKYCTLMRIYLHINTKISIRNKKKFFFFASKPPLFLRKHLHSSIQSPKTEYGHCLWLEIFVLFLFFIFWFVVRCVVAARHVMLFVIFGKRKIGFVVSICVRSKGISGGKQKWRRIRRIRNNKKKT